MNFSHTGSQSVETKLAPTNLADCADEAIHLLELDLDAAPAEFHNHCDRELLVLADSQRLLQVFINLLGNARDACTGNNAQVHVNASQIEGHIRIDVDDNGCGIPPELQSQVFEPFYTTKDPGAGTGLGLALVFSIMEDMNGKVQITSPIAQGNEPGTRVTLHLPRASYDDMFKL
jgi:signal transduction histidine kinase